jgi:hypothetical protein
VFHLPRAGASHLELEAADLTLLLDGIELTAVTRRPRYTVRRDVAAPA